MVYIPESNLPNLAKHQFKSTGYSALDNVLSRFVWEPFVLLFPSTLAPNLITFIGLIFMIASYAIMLPFDQTFTKEPPSYVLFFAAFCEFMYQTLDACDGKQARRLKLASPLGMLMDHGCDSLSCSLIIMTLVQGLVLGLSNDVLVLFVVIQTGFFLTHWEEYHTHYHRTQMFNWGVTEGQWTNIILLILSGIYGASTWQMVIYGYRIETFLIYGNMSAGILISTLMIFTTLGKVKGIQPALRLIPMALLNISLYYWFQSELIVNYAPAVLTAHGLIFAKLNSKLIICSTATMKFGWFDLDIFVEFAFVLQATYLKVLPSEVSFFLFFGFITLRYLNFVFSVVGQLADYLKISVFSVK